MPFNVKAIKNDSTAARHNDTTMNLNQKPVYGPFPLLSEAEQLMILQHCEYILADGRRPLYDFESEMLARAYRQSLLT